MGINIKKYMVCKKTRRLITITIDGSIRNGEVGKILVKPDGSDIEILKNHASNTGEEMAIDSIGNDADEILD